MEYLMELQKLPQTIQNILISPFGAEINEKITKKYNLNEETASKMIDIVNDIYLKVLPIKNLINKIQEVFNFDLSKSKQLASDIAGLKLLIAGDYFQEDIQGYIKNLNGNLENYQKTVELEKIEIKKEIERFNKDMEEEKVQPRTIIKKSIVYALPTLMQEKEASIKFFKNNLVDVLTNKDQEISKIIDDYSQSLISWINEDQEFQKTLEQALYQNQEKLTHKEFVLDAKAHSPTVANWLKDFIKQRGSGMFDNVALADFVTNSKNAKNLDEQEKKLVQKLLQLYRNLKFFPESMPTDTGEGWEIIPI
ncbi:hypothetical protein KKH86_00850, partial [Patescibacteria group bacterium]|nr:hypothetical protein [Patescibacteria group bacterium]